MKTECNGQHDVTCCESCALIRLDRAEAEVKRLNLQRRDLAATIRRLVAKLDPDRQLVPCRQALDMLDRFGLTVSILREDGEGVR